MPAQALAAAAVLVSFVASGNHVDFKTDHGEATLTWYSPATFRFQRTEPVAQIPMPSPLGSNQSANDVPGEVEFTVEDLAAAVRIRSKVLDVTVQKRGLLVSVSRVGGDLIMQDLSEPIAAPNGAVTWERAAPPGVRYYSSGGGPTGLDMDRRGQTEIWDIFILISSAGYGEYHIPEGAGQYGFSKENRYTVAVPHVDYFFYYGPKPKQIFKELNANKSFQRCLAVTGGVRVQFPPQAPVSDMWRSLRGSLLSGTSVSFSGCRPRGGFEYGLTMYEYAPPELLQRARQFGSLAQKVYRGSMPLSDFRTQLESFFHSYEYETEQHGLPLWRPLPFQFPDDAESARHADEFMLGDEMLIAPIYTASDKRSIYLPPGIWTNLATNEELQGRRSIEVETNGLPVFARNGTIVPLDSASGMALHYFPKLGAEFFILEKDANAWTQVHAAPAADAMRLEIESKVARDYEWVVHHVERPSSVGFEERKYAEAASREAMAAPGWFYDAALKNLHVRARVEAGEDRVIHVGW